MGMVERATRNVSPAVKPSGRIPPAPSHELPLSNPNTMASGFVPQGPENTKPAGEVESTLDATLNNLKEIASGHFVPPEDK